MSHVRIQTTPFGFVELKVFDREGELAGTVEGNAWIDTYQEAIEMNDQILDWVDGEVILRVEGEFHGDPECIDWDAATYLHETFVDVPLPGEARLGKDRAITLQIPFRAWDI